MNLEQRCEHFIKRAREKHGDKFDYSKVKYTKQKDPVIIICPIHGEFNQVPDKHLNSKFGCSKCSISLKDDRKLHTKRPKKYSVEESYKTLESKYGDIFSYDFSKFEPGFRGIVLVKCKQHGVFEKTLWDLINANTKYGCNKCSNEAMIVNKTKNKEDFLIQAQKIHGNKYEYDLSNYKNRKSIISIICKEHGKFRKNCQKHLSGQGCIQCTYDNLIVEGKLPGGYCEQTFNDNPSLKHVNAKLYYLSINNGKFYKIGITTINTKNRILSLKGKSNGYIKDCKILQEYDASLYECFLAEQKILSDFDYLRSPRKWSTEIFFEDIRNYCDIGSYFN